RVARAELLRRAGCFPFDVEADRRRHQKRVRELEGVDHRQVVYPDPRALPVLAHLEGDLPELDRPEQPRQGDAAVVVMLLRARTGLEQVDSYEGEGPPVRRSVDGDVLAIHDADV